MPGTSKLFSATFHNLFLLPGWAKGEKLRGNDFARYRNDRSAPHAISERSFDRTCSRRWLARVLAESRFLRATTADVRVTRICRCAGSRSILWRTNPFRDNSTHAGENSFPCVA